MERPRDVHRAPLDGVRAVAVGAVVAFHLGLGRAPNRGRRGPVGRDG